MSGWARRPPIRWRARYSLVRDRSQHFDVPKRSIGREAGYEERRPWSKRDECAAGRIELNRDQRTVLRQTASQAAENQCHDSPLCRDCVDLRKGTRCTCQRIRRQHSIPSARGLGARARRHLPRAELSRQSWRRECCAQRQRESSHRHDAPVTSWRRGAIAESGCQVTPLSWRARAVPYAAAYASSTLALPLWPSPVLGVPGGPFSSLAVGRGSRRLAIRSPRS